VTNRCSLSAYIGYLVVRDWLLKNSVWTAWLTLECGNVAATFQNRMDYSLVVW